MSKKGFWKFVAVALVIAAAVAGCIYYLSRYKDFAKSLDEDFDDFEDTGADREPAEDKDTQDECEAAGDSSVKREYVSIPFEQTPAK